ncbi:putative peptidoglycan glycosyltransferase FtsW [Alphaproteobacteria bacterium SO-S41]|nr:putative peptidoglycan glycosyltransferase FtsW [Alphaproteobacteria bacterium SO-S41]
MMTFDRTNRSAIAEWWWTSDRWLFAVVSFLMFAGVLLGMAASPAIAEKLHYDTFHFVSRQIVFALLALSVMMLVSLLKIRDIRRLSLLGFFGGLALMGLALVIGPEVKGAHRWLDFGPLSIQPSEFTKPAFVVLCSACLAQWQRTGKPIGLIAGVLLYGMFAGMLMQQPDFGQTLLVSMTFGALLFFAGISMWIIGIFIAGGMGAGVLAYLFFPHIQSRVDRFLNPDSGDTYQVDRALAALHNGGFLGVGPGEGTVKSSIPDAHTDFILAVVGEEFGLIACMLLAVVFCFLVLRALHRSLQCPDAFSQIAAAGLAVMLGLQAVINMSVNLQLMPAKGMTLPFISYGGSSIIALALTVGCLIALTRKRPGARRKRPVR